MHIVYASRTPLPHTGGLWTVVSQISTGLRNRGHQVSIVSPYQMPEFWNTVTNYFAMSIRLIFRSWLWFFVLTKMASFFLKRLMSHKKLWDKISLIDAQDPIAFLVLHKTARRRNIPIMLTLHGYAHFESTLGSIRPDSFWGQLLLRMEKKAYKNAMRIVTVDSRIRDYVIRMGINGGKILVRHNFVDCVTFSPATPESKSIEREHWNIEPDVKAICCARRFVEKCGVAYAIQAMDVLKERSKKIVLLIAGQGVLENKLRDLTLELNLQEHVKFLGSIKREDLSTLLKACDAAIIPSIKIDEEVEATSLSALEAMATGIPVIASNIGGLKEIIKDGETSILVPERDPTALADGIEIALSAKGLSIGIASREDILKKFSLERGIDATLSIYEDLKR